MAKRHSYPEIAPGDRFGEWTVQREGEPYISPRGASFTRWIVRCDCGTEGLRNQDQLRTGQSTHCGCRRAYVPLPIGSRFGKLTVVAHPLKRGRFHHTTCKCDCGNQKDILTFSLRSGGTQGCGSCREPMSEQGRQAIGDANRRHGMSKSPEYGSWHALKGRCLNPDDKAYPSYGGRGITVCDRWRDSFEAFFSDMGPRPSSRHSIERLDNDKGYSPSNCEWREYEDQNRNRRNTIFVEYQGEQLPLAALAADRHLPYYAVHRRVFRLGWGVERAISTPLRGIQRRA